MRTYYLPRSLRCADVTRVFEAVSGRVELIAVAHTATGDLTAAECALFRHTTVVYLFRVQAATYEAAQTLLSVLLEEYING